MVVQDDLRACRIAVLAEALSMQLICSGRRPRTLGPQAAGLSRNPAALAPLPRKSPFVHDCNEFEMPI